MVCVDKPQSKLRQSALGNRSPNLMPLLNGTEEIIRLEGLSGKPMRKEKGCVLRQKRKGVTGAWLKACPRGCYLVKLQPRVILPLSISCVEQDASSYLPALKVNLTR